MNLNAPQFVNATHCLCYNSELAAAAYNLSSSSLQSLADQATTQSVESYRTIWNILWSSLTTIFACTWVSCHPNISFNPEKLMEEEEMGMAEEGEVPSDGHEASKSSLKRWWKKHRPNFPQVPTTKIAIITVALIAPECIVMWAFGQYVAAKDIVKRNKGLTMTSAFFSLMGGFVITDQERNPVQILILHPSHLNQDYFKDLLLTITKVDDDIKARLKILLIDLFEASVAADSEGSKPKGFADADPMVDEIIAILLTMIFKTVSESELLRVILGHEAVVQSLTMNMATEAVKITFPIIMEKCKDELSEDLTRETFEDKLRDRFGNRVRKGLPERLRGIKKTLEMDIRGRSKQDSLAKIFALVQTTWFVAQCIARRAQHLPLTEIELTACAYATLSAAIYFFWWDKPFRVDYPIMLRSEISHEVREVNIFTADFVYACGQLLGLGIYDSDDFRGRLQMPAFDSGCLPLKNDEYRNLWNIGAEVLTAVVFGGIHLFAWNYQFPTGVELWLWRIVALMIVGIPMLLWISLAIPVDLPQLIIDIYFLTLLLLYIIARLVILVLSLISLRKLPSGALSNVDWLTFIPHID